MINVKRKIAMQILTWLCLFLFFFSMANYFEPLNYALVSAIYNTCTIFIMYKVTVHFLFPRFYKSKRVYLFYSIWVILLFAGIFLAIDTFLIPDNKNFKEDNPPLFFHIMREFMSMFFTFFVGTSVSLMEQTSKLKENEKLLKEEKLETELKLLKAQINPHFIFNALNNIYSLSYMQSKNAPGSILKLSEMLRYVFYDCSKDKVSLSAEVNYIENFNAFQQMKSEYVQNITLQTDFDAQNIEIAPMLFIPFIENAFKYSRIEENENAFVTIYIKKKDEALQFRIRNSIPKGNKPSSGSGMGIENVKQRLNIIYPNKYELKINEQNDIYTVELNLKV